MSYLELNIIFLGVILGALMALGKLKWSLAMTWTLVILIVATAIFDSVIVGVGIVAYDETRLLGINVGRAPIEDFFYAIMAAIVVPIVWRFGGRKDGKA